MSQDIRKNRVDLLSTITEMAGTLSDAMDIAVTDVKPWIGARMYVLYCFDLRLGEYLGIERTSDAMKLAVDDLASQLAMSNLKCRSLYDQYCRAFYSIDTWFHSGERIEGDESFRSVFLTERIWEVIANGPEAEVAVGSNPDVENTDPAATLRKMNLTKASVSIAEFCQVLAKNQVKF